MQTLLQYIERSKVRRTHDEWSKMLGISRPYFTDIVNGRVTPGTKVIRRINEMTKGKVPPAVWFRQETAA